MADAPRASHDRIESALAEAARFVAGALDTLLPRPEGPEARLLEAVRQAAASEARPLRAFLVLQSGRLFGVDSRPLARVAAAVECAHAFARAHGDLPALGGEARAGRPALHETFGEATAILAGDALLALAFGLLGSAEAIGDPYARAELMARMAQSCGHRGLVGGQMLEGVFAAGDGAPPPLPEITRLQRMKTASLITFCSESGAVLGHASPPARHALSAYGQEVGLAFQIAADLAAPQSGKPTVVSALGAERARAQAAALSAQAVRHLDLFDEKADLLRAGAEYAGHLVGISAL